MSISSRLPVIETDNVVNDGSGEEKGVAVRGRARRWVWGLRRVVASLGVEAIAEFAKGGKKPSGCTLMGITPITDQP